MEPVPTTAGPIELHQLGRILAHEHLLCASENVRFQWPQLHGAVARASVATGAPVMAHTPPASRTGLAQLDLFAEEGLDLGKVQLAHTGDTDDLDYIEAVLARGVGFIGMDRYGLDIFLPTDK